MTKHDLHILDKNGVPFAKVSGGFLVPLLASLAGPLLKGLFGKGVGGISHKGIHHKLQPMTKDMKYEACKLFQPLNASGNGAVGFGAVGFGNGAVGFGPVQYGEVTYPGGAVGFGKKKKAKGGFAVDQDKSKNFSGFGPYAGPMMPINLGN